MHNDTTDANNTFKIISYNTLGPLHGQSRKHDYAPESITRWTRRRDEVAYHLLRLNADIHCLQEVTQRGLKETFIPKLARQDLRCIAYASNAMGGGGRQHRGSAAHKHIGCAIFMNTKKFTVLHTKTLYLKAYMNSDLYQPGSTASSNTVAARHSLQQSIQSKNHILVLAKLQDQITKKTMIIANTHLFWDPRRKDIQMLQGQALLRGIDSFLKETAIKEQAMKQAETNTLLSAADALIDEEDIPIVLCGDFNSLPFDEELPTIRNGLFQLLMTGELPTNHLHHPNSWYTNRIAEVKAAVEDGSSSSSSDSDASSSPRLEALQHDFASFRNIYLDNNEHGEPSASFSQYQPLFTTKTDEFAGWIDHIWVGSSKKRRRNKQQVDAADSSQASSLGNADTAEIEMVLVPPITIQDPHQQEKMSLFTAMPNKLFPSDHLPIGAVIKLN